MTWKRLLFGVAIGAILVLNAGAQVSAPLPPRTSPRSTGPRRTRVEPCWQVAGLSKATMQQRRMISHQARQQMESVCMNSSLSPQQKRAEIRQIHERERQELEGVITPAQREALRVCQAQRGHAGIGRAGRHGVGPCGELSARPHRYAEDEEDEAPATDERKPN